MQRRTTNESRRCHFGSRIISATPLQAFGATYKLDMRLFLCLLGLVFFMATKRRRLTASVDTKRHQGLLSLSELGLPAGKLVAVIDKLRCHADLLDVPVSRKNVYRAQVEAFNAVKTVISVPRNDGSFYDWEICDLGKLLVHLTSECDGLAALLNELFETRPCSKNRPWGLILCFDETVTGDSLRLDVPKKFMAVYCTIKELGPTMLKHEKVWMPLATVRTNVLQHIRRGMGDDVEIASLPIVAGRHESQLWGACACPYASHCLHFPQQCFSGCRSTEASLGGRRVHPERFLAWNVLMLQTLVLAVLLMVLQGQAWWIFYAWVAVSSTEPQARIFAEDSTS